MTGRPSTYTPEIGAEICEWLASGKSLRSWCKQPDKPTFHAVYDWLEREEGFAEAYARARERQAHNDADHINDVMAACEALELPSDVVRVVIDGLKWTAARRAPKAYGDRLGLSSDNDGAPLVVSWQSPPKG